MLAGLLYGIGLITVILNLALGVLRAPAVLPELSAAFRAGGPDLPQQALLAASPFLSLLTPLLVGLLLMGFARVIMLLTAINRSLRGQG